MRRPTHPPVAALKGMLLRSRDESAADVSMYEAARALASKGQ